MRLKGPYITVLQFISKVLVIVFRKVQYKITNRKSQLAGSKNNEIRTHGIEIFVLLPPINKEGKCTKESHSKIVNGGNASVLLKHRGLHNCTSLKGAQNHSRRFLKRTFSVNVFPSLGSDNTFLKEVV